MKCGVIVFPGSNCDHDCFYVLRDVFGQDVEYVWHEETTVNDVDCIVVPGGFSYGDYLRTGAVARFSPIMNAVIDFAGKGGLVIGICNGFQILLEAGLLPGAMLRNRDLHFICKHVYLRTENSGTPFTSTCKKGQILSIPIAHNEGNYFIDDAGLETLKKSGQIVFRYADAAGTCDEMSNPNGSRANIAGIVNAKKNVLGMMPHPERCAEDVLGSRDGFYIFDSMIKWMEEKNK